MTVVAAALIVAAGLVAAGLVVWAGVGGWARGRTARRAVVHTTAGTSLRGILVRVYRDALVLRHAEVLAEQGDPVPVDGDAVVLRAQVAWIQQLGEVER